MPTEKVQNLLGSEDWLGKLVFYYYGPDDKPAVYTVPFFENPSITESQSSNYATYNPIGRAGNLYAYTGSTSRRFNVSFRLTIPHITSVIRDINQVPNGYKSNFYQLKDQMTQGFTGTVSDPSKSLLGAINSNRSDFIKEFDDLFEFALDEASEVLFSQKKSESPALDSGEQGGKYRQKILSKVARMVGVIRSSTLNNARDPVYGPPIVRLNFGALYQDVPCIAKSYRIAAEPGFGYDQRTLMPRVLEVNMELEEARNLGRFNKFDEISKDSLGGWEVVFNHLTTDPGYNFVGIF